MYVFMQHFTNEYYPGMAFNEFCVLQEDNFSPQYYALLIIPFF